MVHLVEEPFFEMRNKINENYLYEGSKNPIIYKNTYELDFHCYYDLSKYPFDYQDCNIEVRI
jgi:hypothetical protein